MNVRIRGVLQSSRNKFGKINALVDCYDRFSLRFKIAVSMN